jgi:hypothetical protein
MTKDQVVYLIEGLAAGVTAPDPDLVKDLCIALAAQYEITVEDLDAVRDEIDALVDEAEAKEAKSQ